MISILPSPPKSIDILDLVLLDSLDMNDLPNTFYSWFPIRKADYLQVYINLKHYNLLFRNSTYLKQLTTSEIKELNPVFRYAELAQLIDSASDRQVSLAELQDVLANLTFVPSKDDKVFLPKDKRQGLPLKEEIWVPTEKFFWSYPQINIGSARHILLFGLQLKGSGRNPLATRVDYNHSWGGQYLWQNFKALTFSRIYSGCLPLGVLDAIGIGLEKNEFNESDELDPFTNSVLMREARSYRLTQVMTDFDPSAPIPKSYYQQKAKKFSPEFYHYQYGMMLALGICDLNITKENLMVNGALMDYEDITYLGDEKTQSFVVNLISRNGKTLSEQSSLDDLGAEATLFTSNFHIYLMGLKLTFEALNKFLETPFPEISEIKNQFKSQLRNINQNIYENDPAFLELVEILSELKGCYVDGIHYHNLQGDSATTLIKFLKKANAKITNVVPLYPNYTSVEIQVQFPRGKWRHPKLESYYQSILNLPVADMAKSVLKIFQMQLQDRKEISLEETLKYSSQTDEFLSQHAWINPYQLDGSTFKLKTHSLSEVKIIPGLDLTFYKVARLSEQTTTGHKLSADELQSQLDAGEEFILQGYYGNIETIKNHFIPVSPIWLRN